MAKSPVVYVVDDDPAICDSIKLLLETVRMNVKIYHDARSFLDEFDAARPACLLLDVRMPGISGMTLLDKLIQMGSPVPVIIMTAHGSVPMAVRALKKGVVDFIEKPFREQPLIDAIRRGIRLCGKHADAGALYRRYWDNYQTLTAREKEVMDFILEGKNNKEISEALGFGYKTADFHRKNILRKMDVANILELTRLSVQINQISPSPALPAKPSDTPENEPGTDSENSP